MDMNGTGHDRCPSRLDPNGDQAPAPQGKTGDKKIKKAIALSRIRLKNFLAPARPRSWRGWMACGGNGAKNAGKPAAG